jgi:hypothetical protein
MVADQGRGQERETGDDQHSGREDEAAEQERTAQDVGVEPGT